MMSASSSEPMSLPSMPPMSTSGAGVNEAEPEDSVPPMPMPMPEAPRDDAARDVGGPPAASNRPATSSTPADEDLIRGSEQFLAVLRHMTDRGGTIRIAAGVELELPTVAIDGPASGRLQIVGESGGIRPRLRFRPTPIPGASPTDWVALMNLRSGSLRLQGLDLVIPEPETRPADRLAAIAVHPGTELILDDCTVTVTIRGSGATAFAVQTALGGVAPGRKPAADPGTAEATIRIRDGFIRSGGDAVMVAGGGRLGLTLEDVMVATEGSLVHALGGPRPSGKSAPRRPALNLKLERVCARVKGGLAHLQTTPEEPEMAAVDIQADRSILSTVTGDHPLFWLEGQDQIERLRDRIRWVGRQVAYHHIKTYRRDEIVHAGGLPRIFERDDWIRAFEPTDESPFLADFRFRQQADAAVPAWKVVRDDLSLAANSAAGMLGPELARIPDPPPSDEEL